MAHPDTFCNNMFQYAGVVLWKLYIYTALLKTLVFRLIMAHLTDDR